MAAAIRFFEASDAEAVALLYRDTFAAHLASVPNALVEYIREVFLPIPAYADIGSRVAVDDAGRIIGFVGHIPLPMMVRGRPVRAIVGSSMMIEASARNQRVGTRLVNDIAAGQQDLYLVESALPHSFHLWERIGGVHLHTASLQWTRSLRPVAVEIDRVAARLPAGSLLRSIALPVDNLWQRLGGRYLAPPGGAYGDAAATGDEVLACAADAIEHLELKPDLDAATLASRLDHARSKARLGPFHARVVLDRNERRIGCFLYHGRRGHRAYVLQLLASPGSHGAVMDRLFDHAYGQGCTAVEGRVDGQLFGAAVRKGCHFRSLSFALAYSRDPELVAAAKSASTLFTGLFGEAWIRLIGDEFAQERQQTR